MILEDANESFIGYCVLSTVNIDYFVLLKPMYLTSI